MPSLFNFFSCHSVVLFSMISAFKHFEIFNFSNRDLEFTVDISQAILFYSDIDFWELSIILII